LRSVPCVETADTGAQGLGGVAADFHADHRATGGGGERVKGERAKKHTGGQRARWHKDPHDSRPVVLGKSGRGDVGFCGYCIAGARGLAPKSVMRNLHPFRPALATASPAEHEVRAQLQLILASDDFAASARNRRFLSHVVEKTLRGEKSSGYEVATQVFGRPETFNATTDPIVRIEAGKLRRDLETYYLKSGRFDRVCIRLLKGVYRAAFAYHEVTAAGEPIPQASVRILHAALLGWSGEQAEAGVVWGELLREYPDLLLDPRLHVALERIHGRDERLRALLLEGLRLAARPVPAAAKRDVAFAGGA
jgi:hypothetical protein